MVGSDWEMFVFRVEGGLARRGDGETPVEQDISLTTHNNVPGKLSKHKIYGGGGDPRMVHFPNFCKIYCRNCST